MQRLTDKVVILTGGAAGMGASHLQRLTAEGANVVFTDLNQATGEALAETVGERAVFVRHDVSDEDGWEQVLQTALECFGGVDILVNNAGIFRTGSFAETKLEDLRRTLEVNVAGTWLGIQKVAPHMRRRGGGSIINLSSMAGFVGMPGYSVYSASKWAVRGITKCAASELGPDNIRVNAILPGAIDHTGMFNSGEMEELVPQLLADIPLKRFAEPAEVSSLVVFLASDESAYITGSDQFIDGGRSLF